jgi:hypothetical protein
MSQGRRLRVHVRGEESALRAALAGLAGGGVNDLKVDPLGERTLQASLRIDDEAREQVSRAIVQAGLGLLDMQTVSSGLESVFLELSRARDSMRPADAPVAAQGGAS